MRPISLVALSVALAPTPALAQAEPADPGTSADATVDASADAAAPAEEDDHHDHHDEIVVTGVRRKAGDVLGGLSVLDSEELAKELRPSLGETLARQPGVSATSFGPSASRPILRGLSGDRIRVLTDGIGRLVLSSSGPGHAISTNPVTAVRNEVPRGPSVLLFGSSARMLKCS